MKKQPQKSQPQKRSPLQRQRLIQQLFFGILAVLIILSMTLSLVQF